MALLPDVVDGNPIAGSHINNVRNTGVQVTTSAARPAGPTEGMVIYETDTDKFMLYNGSSWVELNRFGASDSWTPTLKFGATTQGIASNDSKWRKVGSLAIVEFAFELNSTSGSGNMSITLPVSPRSYGAGLNTGSRPIGWISYYKPSTGFSYSGMVKWDEANTVAYFVTLDGTTQAQWTVNTIPVGINTTDEWHGNCTYLTA